MFLWHQDSSLKWTKVPFQARDPHIRASTTDPATWATFGEALKAYEANATDFAGLGFVLGHIADSDSWISGIDLDDCVDSEGNVETWAQQILDGFKSYAELSPSGQGVKIFVSGCWDDGKSSAVLDGIGLAGASRVELYMADRFFTVTGNLMNSDCRSLTNGTAYLQELHASIREEKLMRDIHCGYLISIQARLVSRCQEKS